MIDISPTVRTSPPSAGVPRAMRRSGYLVSVVVNGALLWVAHNLLGWEWPRFLTQSFSDLLPIVTASFIATMIAYGMYWLSDSRPLRALGDLVTSAFGVAVSVRSLDVFPFDFSSYEYDWTWVARGVLIIALVGSIIGVLASLGRLFRRF